MQQNGYVEISPLPTLSLSLLQVSGQATLPNGAYCPALDKPDQGLELIRDACKNAGLQLNENIGVIIDVGADKLFDQVC